LRLRCARGRNAGVAGPISALLLGLALTGGCGSAPRTPVRTEFFPFTPQEMALSQAARSARYRLCPGDAFSVQFKYEEMPNQNRVLVLPDGYVTMTGVGELKAAGMTLAEVDSVMTARLGSEIRNIDLSVLIEEIGAGRVYVLGQVVNPGLHEIPSQGANVLQAVALAGGFGERACPSETVIMRLTDDGYTYMHVDLGHLEKSGPPSFALALLRPYDVVYVPRSAIGDFSSFADNVLSGVLNINALFWDYYAVTNLNKIERIVR
jgi:protein involved in polysaccharide export with SLBB domain